MFDTSNTSNLQPFPSYVALKPKRKILILLYDITDYNWKYIDDPQSVANNTMLQIISLIAQTSLRYSRIYRFFKPSIFSAHYYITNNNIRRMWAT
jgi:hypothetical protein